MANRKHILVIEESRGLREAIQNILAREGFRVTVTDGGPDARPLLEGRAAEFDLILVSLQLPASPQFDTLEWLRAARRRLAVPIVGMTGPSKMSIVADRLRGLAVEGVQDTRTIWDQLPFRVRALLYPKEAEQRAAVRAPAGVPVNCRFGQAWVQGTIGNISGTGMFVKVDAPREVGGQVLLQFILAGVSRLFEVRARVVWEARRDQGAAEPGLGVEFLDLDEAASSQISAFVRTEVEKLGRIPGT